MTMLKQFFFILALLFTTLPTKAQSSLSEAELELQKQFENLTHAKSDSSKLKLSDEIMGNLKSTLKMKGSFNFPFDLLVNLGKVGSTDEKLRIYSWNCTLDNGEYRYFALLQKKKGRRIHCVELEHNVAIPESMESSLSVSQWLGALYYQVVPFENKNKTCYLLLGWDGNKDRTSKKVIEILSFSKKGEVKLGLPLINWRGKRLSRVVFEYSKQAQMSLKYHGRANCVVFDHLSPSESRYANQFEYYGPDFSYDALEYKNGLWQLIEEFDMSQLN